MVGGMAGAMLCGELRAEEVDKSRAAGAAKRAIRAMQIEDWNGACEAWRETLAADPQNAAAHSNMGKAQYQLREFAAAAESLEKAVALRGNLADTWITLGLCYQELKAPMRAVSCLTRAVHESPADPTAHNALGIVLKKLGWTSAAEAELQKAIDLEPKFADAHFNIAAIYLERRPPALELARRHYEVARTMGARPDETMEAQLAGRDEIAEPEPEVVEAATVAPESSEAKEAPTKEDAETKQKAAVGKPAKKITKKKKKP